MQNSYWANSERSAMIVNAAQAGEMQRTPDVFISGHPLPLASFQRLEQQPLQQGAA
jgi:hypothetical protein